MALTDPERRKVWKGLMRWWSQYNEDTAWPVKEDLYDAVAACDDWAEANQASFNTALPQPFRGDATQEQKTLLLMAVVAMRQSEDFVRHVFGELD